jgi:hypothetical protein
MTKKYIILYNLVYIIFYIMINIRKLINDIYLKLDNKSILYISIIVLIIFAKYFWIALCIILLWFGFKMFNYSNLDVVDYCKSNSNNLKCKKYLKIVENGKKIAEEIRGEILNN